MAPNESGFRGIEVPPYLDSSEHDFLNDFFNPLLSRATVYKRGVGFFTSAWVRSAARGMAQLGENGGTAKWIVSPILDEKDWEAIKRGQMAKRNEVIRRALEEEIEELKDSIANDTLNAIAWMVYDGLLNIRLAVPKNKLSGDFHDKFGVFIDDFGNKIAFHGSQNDSAKALKNYESYDVFCDWRNESDRDRVEWHEDRFDRLWDDRVEDVGVYDVPQSVVEDIATLRKDDGRPYQAPTEANGDGDGEIVLRDYQKEAVEAWFNNENRGIFEMATGTGKTYTALGAVNRLKASIDDPIAIVIAVPVTHLAEQWRKNLRDFGYKSVQLVYGTANPDWKSSLRDTFSDLNIGARDLGIFLTTHVTLADKYFRETIEDASCATLLIADEVHGLGSNQQRQALVDKWDYRLGLSATPERYYDELGTSALYEFFDDIVFSFSLEDAIPEYLVEYEYYPQIVELTDEELEEYQVLSNKLAVEISKEEPDKELIERLAIKRSTIHKAAENKYSKLEEILDEIGTPDHLLVYTDPAQIDRAQEILNEHGIIQHKFTFVEDDEERERLLTAFAEGEYDALVAMQCLDEGVDVPSTRQAILMASSTNPKQFIQRRGRVLRKSKGKDKAEIYDIIVVPSLHPDRTLIKAESSILKTELKRFDQFAKTSLNETQARLMIQRIKTLYELDVDD